MPIYDEEYWMNQESRRRWEEHLAESHQQEQAWFERMIGQYYEEEQQEAEERNKYPLFFWRETCKEKK